MNRRFPDLKLALVEAIQRLLADSYDWSSDEPVYLLENLDRARRYRLVSVRPATRCVECGNPISWDERDAGRHADEAGVEHEAAEDDDSTGVAFELEWAPRDEAQAAPGGRIFLLTDEDTWDWFSIEQVCDVLDAMRPMSGDDRGVAVASLSLLLAFGGLGL